MTNEWDGVRVGPFDFTRIETRVVGPRGHNPIMSDDTEVSETVAPDTAHAWSAEPEEATEAHPVTHRRFFDARIIPAVITGVAVAAVSIAGTLALTPRAGHFTIRPAPVEQIPAPPKAVTPEPPKPAPKAPKAAPPAQHAPAQHLAQPPDARQTFSRALRGDTLQTQNGAGLYPTDPPATVDSEAESMCQDLANGGSIQPYIDGTLRKSPTLAPWQAALVVKQAVEAYCPQYER
jgi:hypothetical protein